MLGTSLPWDEEDTGALAPSPLLSGYWVGTWEPGYAAAQAWCLHSPFPGGLDVAKLQSAPTQNRNTQHPAPPGRTCPHSAGCHQHGVNPWGGPGWERDRAESVLVCQRSGYRSGYCRCCRDVLGLSQPSALSHCHSEHGYLFPSSIHAPVQQ